MKDAKRKITKWVEEARQVCGLHEWTFIVDFDSLKGDDTVFTISCTHNNYEGRIRANLPYIKTLPDWYVRRACYHEVVHAILWELSELASERFVTEHQLEDAVERATERICGLLSEV